MLKDALGCLSIAAMMVVKATKKVQKRWPKVTQTKKRNGKTFYCRISFQC